MQFDTLKKRMEYFKDICDYRLTPNSYVLVHIDGRSFSKMIKKRFELPFDNRFIFMMNETAKYVAQNVQGCKLAYTQSDEISLVLTDFDTLETDSFFGYRLCKLQSIIASLATGKFNQLFLEYLFDEKASSLGDAQEILAKFTPCQFDCKAWSVPTFNDVFAWFKYRQNDCVRNSKQAVAQFYFSHSDLANKSCDEQVNLLLIQEGVSWENDFTGGQKYGRIIHKENVEYDDSEKGNVVRSVWCIEEQITPLTKEIFSNKYNIPKIERV